MTIVAVLGGLYLLTLAPTQAMQTLKISLDQVLARLVPYDADFYPAVPILSVTFSAWIIAFVFAGAFLLMLAKKLLDGVAWARATALGLFAVPAVDGMTMMIPWFVLVLAEYPEKGVPPLPGHFIGEPLKWSRSRQYTAHKPWRFCWEDFCCISRLYC